MQTTKIIKRWYLWQTIMQLLITTADMILFNNNSATLAFFFIILEFTQLIDTVIQPLNNYFQVFISIFTIPQSLAIITKFTRKFHLINLDFAVTITILYLLIAFIPITKLAISQIKSTLGRFFILFIIFSGIDPRGLTIHCSSWLIALTSSGFTNAILFTIVALVAMHEWNFQLPQFKISKQTNAKVILLIIIFITADCFFNGFNQATNWNNLVTNWNFHFKAFNLMMLLSGVKAGIREEILIRFCTLSLLLKPFDHKHWLRQILRTIIISSMLFGLLHLFNIIAGQSVTASIQQAINAFCSGIVFAAIYLYTNSILVTIIYHSIFDLAAFVTSNQIIMPVPTTFDLQETILFCIIYLIFACFLLSGKRKNVILLNLKERKLA
ncbi:CPBP family intramembrane glutamic endopeptidase [Lactobacillus sp. ESL0677]|uniref:CPBP family intramembrane glutamic endopeptidase n=1 Tax=Lactobacillus sp. ESL0677 TaxID=2983208 RepID=UPI0023F82807|nr:CPBP family intramembrane glutamic endopeptidase [Lactobacillus sp. ESL0677]WEV36165.1 CPBP family intramembrane metalloprotease [Lactobacillus sp. ESL0677]